MNPELVQWICSRLYVPGRHTLCLFTSTSRPVTWTVNLLHTQNVTGYRVPRNPGAELQFRRKMCWASEPWTFVHLAGEEHEDVGEPSGPH